MKEFFNELKKDHQEVKDILEKLKTGSKTAEKTREKLFIQLKQELVPHLKAEEATFYQALMGSKNGKQHALEGKEEHDLTILVCKQLEETPAKEDIWAAKLKVLKDLVEHHIREEEQEIFQIAQKEIKEDRFKEIRQNFQSEKERIKGEIS
jgi:hemerythrin-like domain-containing protein